MSSWLADARDVLAGLGLAFVVGLLGYLLGSAHARDVYEQQLAAADSAVLMRAVADSARYATTRAQLDTALAAWDSLLDVAPRVVHDTVERPNDTSTVFLGMAQYPEGADPASLQRIIDSLRTAGGAVVQACRALAQDCDAVRRDRDSLSIALARATVLAAQPASWWSHWRLTAGVGCAVSLGGRAACGPALSAGWSW